MKRNGQLANRLHNRGFTVVELMVSVAVVGILMALLLPAIQQVRATARRTDCVNNLRQIGIATHHFSDVENRLPGTLNPWMELLPYLEQRPLYDYLNRPGAILNNLQTPSVLLCPSDPTPTFLLSLNYRINDGTSLQFRASNGMRREGGLQPTTLQDITDGLSNTAMFSERVKTPRGELSDAIARAHPYSALWHLSDTYDAGEERAFVRACLDPAQHTTTLPGGGWGGDTISGSQAPRYNHFIPPNRPGCYAARRGGFETAEPATSYHQGGVNLLMCDGSVRFVSESVSLESWQAIGSRNGGETVTDF